MPYRIAILLPRFSKYGGVEQFGYRLASELATRGHLVDFICSRKETEPPEGVRVLEGSRPVGMQVLKMWLFLRHAEKYRQLGDYDCVVGLGKTLHQDVLRVGGGSIRELWKHTEKGFPSGPGSLWKKIRRRMAPSNWLTMWIEKQQYSGDCPIVANSHFIRDVIMAEHPVLQAKSIDIIYNRPDLSQFAPPSAQEREKARATLGIIPDCTAVGFATSSFPRKGTEPLVRSFSLLPKQFHLYVAGGRGHKHYDALARQLGIGDRVHFLGRVDTMPLFYKALDVFALPSFFDACSNTVVEALATGLPTVSSSTNGSSYFLPPEWVVSDPNNIAELAEAIQKASLSERGKVFDWPEDIRAGMDTFIDYVESVAIKKRLARASQDGMKNPA